ncbi:hypothetical protein KFK09_025232 [Dendrobium nobile]|uniref:Protein LURP-one-related 6 n=1 Tax=Dendrobium nobile TaxID=94219 RepID=A0A8T3ALH5_DENNO|nr:hypothetical protein KFK09_025232 [Dendrobium nobile]
MARSTKFLPIVSKIYCSSSKEDLIIRKRPVITSGGGFVVINSKQEVIFAVDGCGILGASKELILRDDNGAPVLFICNKNGVVQVLSFHSRWKGYLMDYEGIKRLVFSLREPKKGCLVMNNAIKISIMNKGFSKDWDYEVKGSFSEKDCTINDRKGDVVAQVGGKGKMAVKDFYEVVVQPGYDLAFVVGVIAVLDSIHGESTRC